MDYRRSVAYICRLLSVPPYDCPIHGEWPRSQSSIWQLPVDCQPLHDQSPTDIFHWSEQLHGRHFPILRRTSPSYSERLRVYALPNRYLSQVQNLLHHGIYRLQSVYYAPGYYNGTHSSAARSATYSINLHFPFPANNIPASPGPAPSERPKRRKRTIRHPYGHGWSKPFRLLFPDRNLLHFPIPYGPARQASVRLPPTISWKEVPVHSFYIVNHKSESTEGNGSPHLKRTTPPDSAYPFHSKAV